MYVCTYVKEYWTLINIKYLVFFPSSKILGLSDTEIISNAVQCTYYLHIVDDVAKNLKKKIAFTSNSR